VEIWLGALTVLARIGAGLKYLNNFNSGSGVGVGFGGFGVDLG
jgi:hypothetical protein